MAKAQDRGLAAGIEVNSRRAASITSEITQLRAQWRQLSAREGLLRNEVQALGIEPEAVPKRTVREVAAARETWRDHPATDAQIRKLEELSREVDTPFDVDPNITKGQAHDAISGILSGTITQVQFRDRPAGPMFIEAAEPRPEATQPEIESAGAEPPVLTPRPVVDPVAEVERRLMERLAAQDPDADAAVGAQANTADQFLDWATGHFKVKAQVALADLMSERDTLTDEMFVVCRTILADPKRWSEFGHRAAEAYWEAHRDEPIQHPTTTAVTDAIVEARASEDRAVDEGYLDTAQGVLADVVAEGASPEERAEQVEAIQDALDFGAGPELDDWWARGRAAFDAAMPMDLPAPETDPGLAAALGKLRSRRAREELTNQWFAGARQGQREATADDRAALLTEAAHDPRVIAEVGGRTTDYLPSFQPHTTATRNVVTELARGGSPLRQAAAQLILREHDLPTEFYEASHSEWQRAHGHELTWDETTRQEWTSWMRMQLRRDPLIGSWAGYPMATRTYLIETGIETAFAVLAEERPDLVEATASIPASRLAAELRGDIIPNLYAGEDAEAARTAHLFKNANGSELTLRSFENSTLRPSPVRGWDFTLNGGGTSTTCGRDPRAALGAILDARSLPIPEWIERVYRPYAQARETVLNTAVLYERGHEFYHAAARSDLLWKYDDRGNAAASSDLVTAARESIIEDLRRTLPEEVALLEATGIDLDWTLRTDVDNQVMRDLRTAGTDSYGVDTGDISAGPAGSIYVGDPNGTHVVVNRRWAQGFTSQVITIDDQVYAGVDTIRDAIAEARAQLARSPQSTEPTVETGSSNAPARDERIVDVEVEEADPSPPRVVAPVVDDTGAITFDEVDTDQGPIIATGDQGQEWVLADHLVVDHIGPATAPPPEVDTAAADVVEEFTAASGELIVPDTEFGEPISSPLWRTGDLVKVRKESGGYAWISPATAARYASENAPEAEPEAPTQPEAASAAETAEPAVEQQEPRAGPQSVAATDFALGTGVHVPSGAKARVRANIAAARLVLELDEQQRPATAEEQAVLAQWSGWGAVPEVFDSRSKFLSEWADERAALLDLLGEKGFSQARETTLNAHYTDPAIVGELWRAVQRAGLPDGALLVEPGCGAGHFVGTAPAGVNMVGVEIEPISAKIAHYLYPSQQIRNHGFERAFATDNTFTGAIGNVPFGRWAPVDPIHNAAGLTIHNAFIAKSLALTAPGGYVAVVTSKFTSDAKRGDQRAQIAAKGDLVGAVRLPTGAFDRQAGTPVVTDVLVFRRREDDAQPTQDTVEWALPARQIAVTDAKTGEAETYWINSYFQKHPDRVLGRLAVGNGQHGNQTLIVQPDTATPLAEQLRAQLDPIIDQAVEQGLGFTAAAPNPADVEVHTAPGLRTGADLDSSEVLPGTMRFNEVDSRFEQFTVGRGWSEVNCRGKDLAEQWKKLIALGETVMELSEASRDAASTVADRDVIRGRLNGLYDDYTRRWGPLNRFKLTAPKPLTEEKIADRLDKAITKWREKVGRAEAIADGIDPEDAGPYTGSIPDDVLDEMQEKAAEEPKPQKNQHHLQGAIARDPRLGMVLAIEDFQSRFDGTDAVATKSAIFTEDTTPFKERAQSAADIDEALAISFDELGHISPARMAELLDLSVDEILDRADGRIYPSLQASDQWELATVALSGQVRSKLAIARIRATDDPRRYAGLVTALEGVIPPEVDPTDIGVRPGATWIPVEDYRQFLIEEFGLNPRRLTVEHDEVTGNWKIATEQSSRHQVHTGYADKYGNSRLTGVQMMELIANNKPVQVNKTKEELEFSPKPRFHVKMTETAQSAANALQERFEKWLWSDGDRYLRLAQAFNEKHNSFVKPAHSGEHKSFPGLNPKYKPYDYQAAAVQRFLHDETILLDHVVGAGKTVTITTSCMEAKRLGQINQPWIVVPNHLLAQWSAEARDAYPNAKILVASELDGRDDRQRFVGQTAVGDWDLVIVPQSVFGLIGMRREAQIEYLEGEITELRIALDAANERGAEFSVKQIENAIKGATSKIENLVAAKSTDEGLTFEQSGADFLFVDEAHDYKNLTRPSNSTDLSVADGSQRATDLEMKAKYLREQAHRRNAERGLPNAPAKAIAFATGTPITNSLSEIWVMMKYLRPDLLTEAGLGRIDNWAGTFAKPVTVAEMNATATRLQMKTRMAEYANVPQLVAMYDQFRDVVTSDQIPVRLPEMEGGAPTIVEFDMGQDAIDAVADLDVRLANINGDRMDLDNSLKVSTDGRNLTMHPRLANLPAPAPENSRVEHAADLIWQCHADNADVQIPADKYGPEMTGVFQLVFCDRGTPKAGSGPRARNVYTELRDALVERGMKPEEIAFMHDYDNPKAKAKLVEACADGRIRVLITSTKKGGTGLNVQRALKQMVNLDPAWTAADMEQRIGRIIRQGNVNETVSVVNMVARRSYDAMMYQYVARKASFVGMIRKADLPPSMEDIGGDLAASWAQSKAAATGDPVFVQQVEADQRVANLEARRDAVLNANAARNAAIRGLQANITATEKQIPELRGTTDKLNEWAQIEDRAAKMWNFPTGPVADGDTADLGDALRHALINTTGEVTKSKDEVPFVVLNGVPVKLAYVQVLGEFYISVGGMEKWYDRDQMNNVLERASTAQGMLGTIRRLAAAATERIPAMEAQLERDREKLAAAQAEPELEFTQTAELDNARLEADELRLEVNARENSPEALRRAETERERRAADGQYERWTLDLNPTEAWAEQNGMSREDLIASVPAKMAAARQAWADQAEAREANRKSQPWVATDATEAVWQYGFDAESKMPGARISWNDRQWNWEAWDGQGSVDTDTANTRGEAFGRAARAAGEFAQANDIPESALREASIERRQRLEGENAVVEPTEPVAAADSAVVEPTEPIAETSIDDSIARGLGAGTNLRPLRDLSAAEPPSDIRSAAEENRPTERELDLGEDDGRAV